MTPTHQELVAYATLLLEVGSDGGRDLARVEAAWSGLSPLAADEARGRIGLLRAIARRLQAGEPVDSALEAPWSREIELARWARRAVRRLDGLVDDPPPERASDPAARAVRAAAALVEDVERGADRARIEAELGALGPDSPWLHVVRRIVERAVEERDTTWEIAADGAWFRAPRGARVEVTPLLARLLVALAGDRGVDGPGLDVEAMFAAGWPGERARRDAAANRVRVAVTALRQRGLVVLGWERGRGWSLGAPIRTVP
jgi:hypothetical protein